MTTLYRGCDVLVTGATGLVGSHLIPALLSHGARVHALVLPDIEADSLLVRSGTIKQIALHRGRLEDDASVRRIVRETRPKFVFHLGAQTLVGPARQDPVTTFEVNIGGTWRVLEACRQLTPAPVAIVVASSDKAYGPSARLPYRESDPLAGEEPYEVSKAATDLIARTFAVAYGLRLRIARCGNIYGAGDFNWSRLIPGTIRSVLLGRPPVIRSDGTPIRDYISVEDVVSAYVALGSSDVAPGEAFNFSSGEKLAVLDVVRLIARAAESTQVPLVENTARGELAEQWLDSSKARSVLRWAPKQSLGESLPTMLAWYRELLGSSDAVAPARR